MPRIALLALLLVTVVAGTPAAAQDNRAGCNRDVQRLCRSVIDGGDMAVLACLKQNRSRISKTCNKVLTDNGQ